MKYKITWFLLHTVALLPLPVLYAISSTIWPILYYVIRYRRKVTRTNLQKALPHLTPSQIRQTERNIYRHMCDIIVETVKQAHISDAELERRITINNTSLVDEMAKKGHPVFVLIGHYGNWEWTGEMTRRLTTPEKKAFIYEPVANETMDLIMQKLRHRFCNLLLPKKKAARTILSLKRENQSYLVGFISDQRPNRHSLHHWTTFLHQDTPYMGGAEELGQHVDAVCLYLHMEQPRRGYYNISFEELQPVEGEEYPYTVAYLHRLEQDIEAAPHLWLWTHKRWKHKRPTV